MASFPDLRRIYTSAKYGIQQAISSYNAENFVAEVEFDWDSQPSRMARYWHNRRYADNTVYNAVNRYVETFKFREKLYKHIRGIYNPIWRLSQIEASKVLGGSINYETFEDGAFSIVGADERQLDAIRKVYKDSNMDLLKTLFVREGAIMGDSVLKIVDDVDKQKVRIEYLDPRKVTHVEFDAVGNVKYIDICYEREDDFTGQWYEYRETIDKEYFRTYRNGAPYDYEDMSPNGMTEWANPYGFVPVRWAKHVSTGNLEFGQTSFHASRHKIDQINDLLSLVLHNLRMQVMTKYAVSGVNVPRTAGSPTTMQIEGARDDQAPFIEVGDAGKISPIIYPVNVEGALAQIAMQIKEVENDLPQLAMSNMRSETGNTSGVAIENLYSDAHDILSELQANYLFALKSATQMAMSIGAYRGYPEFRGFTLDSYENGALDFDMRPKSLFKDSIGLEKKLNIAMQAVKSEAASLILPKLGIFAEEDIEALELKKDERDRQNIRAAFDNLMDMSDDSGEDEDDMPMMQNMSNRARME